MSRILIKGGWLGRNTVQWYESPDGLGQHIVDLYHDLKNYGHDVAFAGEKRRNFLPDLEIHIERQFKSRAACARILIYSEPDFVQPQNVLIPEWNYNVIFDWRTDRAEGPGRRRYIFPRSMTNEPSPYFGQRDILISCIAGNKNAIFRSQYSLYETRNTLIESLSEKLGLNFHLYGGGWELRNHPIGFAAKILFKIGKIRWLWKRSIPLSSYMGRCSSKNEIMKNSLFTLCVENSSAPGSMSEKIIDCFQYGSVPLYLGAGNVRSLIPDALFVDLRDFDSVDDLKKFILNYDDEDYQKWRVAVEENFSLIENSRRVENFVKMVAREVQLLLQPSHL